ncbi:MAG: hypothetical protein GY918_13125, partial [Gammaproteobacteria bacterium]|nr:hypothetical protein [Gammaproteobacteria bacterium]
QLFSPSSGVGTIAVATNASAGAGTLTFQAGSTETMRISSGGNVSIGGTLPSAPNIQLNDNGSIVAAAGAVRLDTNGLSTSGNPNGGNADGIRAFKDGYFMASRGSADPVFTGYTTGTSQSTVRILANGSAAFAGDVEIGGGNIELNSDGSATYNSGQFNIATYKRTAAGGGVQISLENGNGTTRTLSNDASGHLFFGYAGANQAALTNSGNFQVGGTLTSAANIELNGSDGSAEFAGSVSIGGTAAANTIDEYE